MIDIKYISTMFTWKLISIVIFLHLIDIAFAGQMSYYLALNPYSAIEGAEFWRVVTYPFAQGNTASLLLFLMTFTFFGTKVELNLGGKLFSLYLFLITIFAGTLNSVLFYDTQITFQGMDILSFFLMGMFLFLNPKIKIQFFNITQVSGVVLSALFLMIWFGTNILEGFQFEKQTFFALFSLPIIAITMSFLISIILKFRFSSDYNYSFNDEDRSFLKEDNRYESDDDDLHLELITKELRKKSENRNEEKVILTNDPQINEDKMNEILDKILEQGKDSLSTNEKRFMTEYSKYL